MTTTPKVIRANLTKAIQACVENASRMIDETYDLEFRASQATRYFLTVIAQEETAKAFILYLIRENIAPFNAAVRRSIRDHACKHLVGMIMDYMIRHWDTIEELQALISQDYDLEGRFPHDVASAINILCHEKIGRWTRDNWAWDEDPDYDRAALNLADGKKDRAKQDALYVRIGADGRVATTPDVVTQAQFQREFELAKRYLDFARSLDGENGKRLDERRFANVVSAFGHLFGTVELKDPEASA